MIAFNTTAQMIPRSLDHSPTCETMGTLRITVTDHSGAVIPNAFVFIRADQLGNRKAFQLELHTNSVGNATASVPCGYVDVFIARDGFAPHAEKVLVRDTSILSLALEVYSMPTD